MTWRDAIPLTCVRHALFSHWGLGVIIDRRTKDNLGLPTAQKILVAWDNGHPCKPKSLWMRLAELKKVRNS